MYTVASTMNTYSPASFPSLYLVLAALYWASVTVLHEAISNKIVVPFKNMLGAVPTEYAFVGLTLCGMWGLFWAARGRTPRKLHAETGSGSGARKLTRRAFQRGEVRRVFACWLVLVAAAGLCSGFLMVTRIEMAHFPQYAILGTLLRLGGLSPGSAYLAGQCGSIMDEGRQYLVHPRFTGYFDWNDLLINSVGLCMGLLLAHQGDARRVLRFGLNRSLSWAVARVSAALLVLWAVALLAGLACGYVRAYVPLAAGQPPDTFPWVEGSRVLALFLREAPPFWQTGPFGQFHVMGVGEGMFLYPLCSLLLFRCCFYRKNTPIL